MELLIVIAPMLIIFVLGVIVVSIQDWITDIQFYRRRTQRELNRVRRSIGKTESVKYTMSDGRVATFGPVEIFVFDEEKVDGDEEEETFNEAERVLKEARDRKID